MLLSKTNYNMLWILNIMFCRQLQPATILTRFIAALTRLRELLLYAYPCTTMTTSSDLETVDVSWKSCVNCSFRMKAINPKLGSNTWHNIIYTYVKITLKHLWHLKISKNCSMRPFYYVGITSACYVYKKNSCLHDSAHKFWHFWWFRTQILENDRLVETMPSIHIISIGLFKNIC